MTRFVVDLGDIKMTEKAEADMADEIQKAVLGRIARLDVREPVAIKFPREWWGIIVRPDFDSLPGIEKEIMGFTRG